MALERDPTSTDREGMRSFTSWAQTTQKCTYWILRMIAIGAIKPVDMRVAHATVDRFCRTKGSIVPQRTIERVIIVARLLCIITSLHCHYAYENSPRAGETPTVEHMTELQSSLVVTAEQAKFAIGLFDAAFEDRTEGPVLDALSRCTLRPEPDLGYCYLRVVGCETAQQLVDEIVMHMDKQVDVTSDSVHALMGKLRTTKIVSHPHVPCIDHELGVRADKTRAKQNYYAMRGNAIHVSLVTDRKRNENLTVEQILEKHCHIGPPGKEITAQTVPGFAHILKTRTIDRQPDMYVKECMFLPSAAAKLVGGNGVDTVTQPHRRHSHLVVDVPMETATLKKRGSFQKWTEQQRKIVRDKKNYMRYPEQYTDEVAMHEQNTSGIKAGTRLDTQQCDALRQKLPAQCFFSSI